VEAALRGDGIRVLTQTNAVWCGCNGIDQFLMVRHHDGTEEAISFDAILCATGRTPRTDGFGLEELGIPISENRTIETDEWLQTLYPNIYACGDVAGPYQFTHVAGYQGWYASVNALFGGLRRFRPDYSVIPWTTFTDPEVGRAGLSEGEAKKRGVAYEVTRYNLAELDRAITDEAPHGFIKIVSVPGKDRILGVTVVGAHAGEILAEFVLAMKQGIGLNKILATIHAYPTWTEAGKNAAGEWRRSHMPNSLLKWAEKYLAWRRG
jgi:pyruvate/2-oxoglutarate dehydrogenase complex dihydrolipoamide dehydrogenase (E3) component